jgi:lipopolysaccharide transport system ATP-binding protein
MSDAVIVEGVGKRFATNRKNQARRLKEFIVRGASVRARGYFWALRDVSFTVRRGESFGIVGANGVGKSTLLRLIGRVGAPEEGAITVNGRLGGLLELAAGFSFELTGRDNSIINGVVAGLTRREVLARMDDIVSFAELTDFIDAPVRTYSSGMKLRLGFSVAMHTEPEILLIDEVLAVGDIGFQRKCHDKIAEIKKRGCTLILVSHDPAMVRQFCDRVLLLRKGEECKVGPPAEILEEMMSSFARPTEKRTPVGVQRTLRDGTTLTTHTNRLGSLEAEITGVHLFDGLGREVHALKSGDSLVVLIDYVFHRPVESAWFQVQIVRERRKVMVTNCGCGLGTEHALDREGTLRLEIDRLELVEGQYFVDVGLYQGQWDYAYDYHSDVYPLRVESPGPYEGLVRPPSRWISRR